MKQLIKKILKFINKMLVAIEFLVGCILHFLNDIFNRRYHKIPHNKRKDRVIVMGNGPSLNYLDFNKLNRKNYTICCVNYYPLKNEMFQKLKPEFLCLLDPGFFDFTTDTEAEDFEKFNKVLKAVDWNIKIIVPAGKRLKIENSHITYEWINSYTAPSGTFNGLRYWFFKHNVSNPGTQNVVLGALYYFLTCNYEEIYLTGVDMSDFKFIYVDEDNRVYVDSTHSYGSKRYYYDEMPGSLGLNEFSNILGAYQRMFAQFSQVRGYADYLGIDIVNLSVDSYIDVFKKMNPNILIKGELKNGKISD